MSSFLSRSQGLLYFFNGKTVGTRLCFFTPGEGEGEGEEGRAVTLCESEGTQQIAMSLLASDNEVFFSVI